MSADCDVIVVGAGHNGLVAAGYLARAGKRVLVLERNDYPGGGVATAELAEPGFWSERHGMLHVLIMANPLITEDELGLQADHGLDYIQLDKPYAAVFDDGSFVPIYRDRARTLARLEQMCPRDAEAYDRFMDVAVPIAEMLMSGFFVPPQPLTEQMEALARAPLGREVMRATNQSIAEVFAEWFEDERLRITLTRMASEIILTHPDDLNTGIIAYVAIGFLERFGMAIPRGGGAAFANACVDCIASHGGELRLSTDVDAVLTEGGRAVGVRTTAGEELRAADAVLASIHPHLLGERIEGIDPELARAARRTRLSPFTGFVVHAALEEPVRFRLPEVDEIVMNTLSTPSIDSLNRTFDDLRRGRLPEVPLVGGGCPSNVDPSRAPDGKAVLHAFSMTTRNLADGGPGRWPAIREQMADRLLERIAEFSTNLSPSIIRSREIVTPLDHEVDSPSFTGGDICGIAMYSHQMGAMRPIPELARYTVPGIERLYLTGPFMHPGGGIVGGGRPTAIRMFEDLGLDFSAALAG